MKGRLVHVEYPTPATMEAKKERTSELHELPHLIINLLRRTHCLVGFLAINILVLFHEAPDCAEMSFNALGAKGTLKHQQHLQEDDCFSDADPLLASSKDPHEQLILDRMELLIGSSKVGPLFSPGVGLQTRQILLPPHKERVAYTKLHRRVLE
jgi:hypothetical protein